MKPTLPVFPGRPPRTPVQRPGWICGWILGSVLLAAVPAPAAPPATPTFKTKPLNQWDGKDWKQYGESIAQDPDVQKMPPLDRARYVADKVGQRYDAAGIKPNNWYFGKGRQGIGEAPGTCGDLTVNINSALEGAGFQTGSIEVEQEGLGYYNPFNVNRNHGAPVVQVDGKEYVMDLWYHSGAEGRFSGFRKGAFTMPLDDWKSFMKEEGYAVSTYAPPPPPPKPPASPGKTEPEAKPESAPETGTAPDLPESPGKEPGSVSPPDRGNGPETATGEKTGTEPPADSETGETGETPSDDENEGVEESDPDQVGTDNAESKPDETIVPPEEPEDSAPEESVGGGTESDDEDSDDGEAAPDGKDEADTDAEENAGPDDAGDGEPEDDAEGSPPEDSQPASGTAPDADNAPGESTITKGYVEGEDGSRITITETRDADGKITRATETETDAEGNVISQTTYEGGTGEGKTTPGTPDLRDAEPPSDADVDVDLATDGYNAADDFSTQWTDSQQQRGADSSLTMAQNSQMEESANIGNQQIRDAQITRDAGGRDARNIRDDSARNVNKADRENSWGKAIGDAVESGITEGGKAFGQALGQGAADEVVGEIFGSDEDDSDSAGESGAGETQTAGSPSSGSSSSGSSGRKNPPASSASSGGSKPTGAASSGSGSSGAGTASADLPVPDPTDPIGVTGSTRNPDGTITITYGCGYTWTGKPPGPSRCPICDRETVSTATNTLPAAPTTPTATSPSPATTSVAAPASPPTAPKKTRAGCPVCKAPVTFQNDHYLYGRVYKCANGHFVKGSTLITVEIE